MIDLTIILMLFNIIQESSEIKIGKQRYSNINQFSNWRVEL